MSDAIAPFSAEQVARAEQTAWDYFKQTRADMLDVPGLPGEAEWQAAVQGAVSHALETIAPTFEPLNDSALRRFAREIFAHVFNGGNFDGGELQELGVKHGLLQEVTATQACGETCACAEVADFPTTCFRYAPAMNPDQAPVEVS